MIAVGLDAARIEHRLAVVCGYLGDAGYQTTLTDEQVREIHEGIGALAALQAMCGTLRRVGTLQLTLEPGEAGRSALEVLDEFLLARAATSPAARASRPTRGRGRS
jgi:hypothetical protein